MRTLLIRIVALSLIMTLWGWANTPRSFKNSFKILCYHNVVDRITDTKIMNVTTDQLISHFKWLRAHHYHVISVDDILAAKRGERRLPENAVLLTFDDGYVSFYTRIYPLLKLYHYPAVFALVGKWEETPLNRLFRYGSQWRSRKMLLTWSQIKEMMDSGLVEFASHSYDSHHGILANPQGNREPALTTLAYDPKTKRYESTQHYIRRITDDLQRSSDVIYRHTGKRPRIVVWPYGAYNGLAQKAAARCGMPITMTLDDGTNTPADLPALKRILIDSNPTFDDFYWSVANDQTHTPAPEHTLFVNIAELYDPDPAVANARLGVLIEKVRRFKVSTVVINAGSDLDHDGYVDTLYFPNETLPMRSDFLNRAVWQLRSRAPIEDVYVQLQLYAFERDNKPIDIATPEGQKALDAIYYALSRQAAFKGILFDLTFDPLHLPTQRILSLSRSLYSTVRDFSPKIKTALILDASRLSQKRFTELLGHFTYLYLDTSALLKAHKSSFDRQLGRIVSLLKSHPDAAAKSLLLLDERSDSEDRSVIHTIEYLHRNRIVNIGYRPAHFVDSMQSHSDLIKIFSLRESPFE